MRLAVHVNIFLFYKRQYSDHQDKGYDCNGIWQVEVCAWYQQHEYHSELNFQYVMFELRSSCVCISSNSQKKRERERRWEKY